jgi:hypothetical protein
VPAATGNSGSPFASLNTYLRRAGRVRCTD